MAKAGKLGKLLKKMQSLGKTSSTNRSTVATASNSMDSSNLIPVYVGQTRRRYMVSSEVVGHPLFRELVDSGNGEEVSVGCEVVMFEHLLWMLDNADDPQPESLDELVDFYAC